MTIFIGADHRGFELKNQIIEYLQEKNIRVEDMGALQLDPLDDNPDYAKKVAEAVLQNPSEFLGIVICATGIGVSIMANRFRGIRCGVAYSIQQVKAAKEDDNINVLALAADYTDLESAKPMIDMFMSAKLKSDEKYQRRINKLDGSI